MCNISPGILMSTRNFGTQIDSEELPTEMATISDEQYFSQYICIHVYIVWTATCKPSRCQTRNKNNTTN